MTNGRVDLREFQRLQKQLEAFDKESTKFIESCAKELAARLLGMAIKRTPVGKAPKLETKKVKGASGKSKSFLTASGAKMGQHWAGYMGGTLRRGWLATTHEQAKGGSGTPKAPEAKAYAQSLKVNHFGGIYVIEITNPIKYSSHVESGHRQAPGRFVPALGKCLKAGWVKRVNMLEISEQELQRVAPKILEQKVNRKLREMMR